MINHMVQMILPLDNASLSDVPQVEEVLYISKMEVNLAMKKHILIHAFLMIAMPQVAKALLFLADLINYKLTIAPLRIILELMIPIIAHIFIFIWMIIRIQTSIIISLKITDKQTLQLKLLKETTVRFQLTTGHSNITMFSIPFLIWMNGQLPMIVFLRALYL
ncbi:hypothetical protein TRFO_22407 [Tritrichomonas foetus]|uniref:Uncharacterized protein n=1 Tax=Tritrichomonas foetus TaxID=1144522 RepID=A0A1J4KHV2_9EUKA|nr:hypothetical protein TRFO_22407 [Tritrichomonas foetus]|eukprot:OHT08909.1 hypothetical protein TRFO_22407 [Tritrichomonas foetus]